MLKIETGIPVKNQKGRPHSYPFEKMKVGDSFFVEVGKEENAKYAQTKFATLARRYAIRYLVNGKFCTSIDEKQGKLGVRVWRIN